MVVEKPYRLIEQSHQGQTRRRGLTSARALSPEFSTDVTEEYLHQPISRRMEYPVNCPQVKIRLSLNGNAPLQRMK